MWKLLENFPKRFELLSINMSRTLEDNSFVEDNESLQRLDSYKLC